MRCRVCNAPYRGERICTRCGIDLGRMLDILNRSARRYNDAVTAARRESWYEALEMIDQAIDYVGSRAEYFVLRGKIHAHLHRYSDAARDWRRAAALEPSGRGSELLAVLDGLVGEMRE